MDESNVSPVVCVSLHGQMTARLLCPIRRPSMPAFSKASASSPSSTEHGAPSIDLLLRRCTFAAHRTHFGGCFLRADRIEAGEGQEAVEVQCEAVDAHGLRHRGVLAATRRGKPRLTETIGGGVEAIAWRGCVESVIEARRRGQPGERVPVQLPPSRLVPGRGGGEGDVQVPLGARGRVRSAALNQVRDVGRLEERPDLVPVAGAVGVEAELCDAFDVAVTAPPVAGQRRGDPCAVALRDDQRGVVDQLLASNRSGPS